MDSIPSSWAEPAACSALPALLYSGQGSRAHSLWQGKFSSGSDSSAPPSACEFPPCPLCITMYYACSVRLRKYIRWGFLHVWIQLEEDNLGQMWIGGIQSPPSLTAFKCLLLISLKAFCTLLQWQKYGTTSSGTALFLGSSNKFWVAGIFWVGGR